MNKKLGFLALLAVAVGFSFSGILVRTLSYSFGDSTQVAIRFFIASILLWLWTVSKKFSFKLDNIDKVKLAIFLLGLPLAAIFFTRSVNLIKATNAVFYVLTAGIITSLALGIILFKEKIHSFKIIALLLAGSGLFIFAQPINASVANLGVLFGLLAGVSVSLTNAMRKFFKEYKPSVLLYYQYTTGFIIALALAIFSGEKMVTTITSSSVIAAIAFGLILVTAGALLMYGFQNFDLNLGTIVTSSELFFATLINALFLKELPISTEILGGTLMLIAILVINLGIPAKAKR